MGCDTSTQTSDTKKVFKAILIGPPGCGKGTQCDILKKKVKFAHVSTGDLIRTEIKNKTEVGLKIKEATEKGQLVPDDVICQMLVDYMKMIPEHENIILDGFPRTEAQAKFLKAHFTMTDVIELVGDEKEITERLTGRLFDPETNKTYHKVNNPPPADVAGRCVTRKDDTVEVIQDRFKIYNNAVAAIKAVFGNVKQINTTGRKIDEISKDVDALLL